MTWSCVVPRRRRRRCFLPGRASCACVTVHTMCTLVTGHCRSSSSRRRRRRCRPTHDDSAPTPTPHAATTGAYVLQSARLPCRQFAPCFYVCLLFVCLQCFDQLVGRQEGHPACKKTEWWGAGVVICLERGADSHLAQLMPLPLTVSCFSEIQTGSTFLVPAYLGSPRQRAVKRVCVCVCVCFYVCSNNLYSSTDRQTQTDRQYTSNKRTASTQYTQS